MLSYSRISPRIVNSYVDIVLLEGTIDVDNFGVTNVRTILLKGETKNDNL